MSADAAYAAYAAKRESERQREHARDLQDAVRDLHIKKKVLIDAVAQDPTSPAAAELLACKNR